MFKKNKKTYIFGALFLFVLILIIFLLLQKGDKLDFKGQEQKSQKQERQEQAEKKGEISPFSGLACQNYRRRPIAVMLSGDAVTRPLSGFNSADLVVNMPVITDSITRFMAVYVCGEPKEIGSVRSARDDFIPLVQGWDAIYAHWGGSHFALDALKRVNVDDLDALPNYANAFYRKAGIAMPHNGFTSMSRLLNAAKKIGYNLENKKTSIFKHLSIKEDTCRAENCQTQKTLNLGFSRGFDVSYKYDPQKNIYLRFRAGLAEIDKNDGQQVAAKVVIVMRVQSRQIEGQYNDVEVIGSGDCQIYQNGTQTVCRWQKKSALAPLRFLDVSGHEIKLVPGQIWIEMIQTNQKTSWE